MSRLGRTYPARPLVQRRVGTQPGGPAGHIIRARVVNNRPPARRVLIRPVFIASTIAVNAVIATSTATADAPVPEVRVLPVISTATATANIPAPTTVVTGVLATATATANLPVVEVRVTGVNSTSTGTADAPVVVVAQVAVTGTSTATANVPSVLEVRVTPPSAVMTATALAPTNFGPQTPAGQRIDKHAVDENTPGVYAHGKGIR